MIRGLRTIPVVLGIVRDMEEVCPDAWFLNYTNPMAMLVRAVSEASGIRTVGLCHSRVLDDRHAWPATSSVPPSEIDDVSAGVNHLAWVLRLEHRGRDLYPDLRAFVDAGRVPDDDLVRAELFRRFGFYPTESSEHHAEYNPWFIPKGDARRPIPHPDRGVPRSGREQPRRVRGHQAAARCRRAVRDRAQRRVRGRDRRTRARPASRHGSSANVMNGPGR